MIDLASNTSVLGALLSVGAAIFSYLKARSIFSFETKIKFKDKKLEKLGALFDTNFVIHISDKHLPSVEELKALSTSDFDALIQDRGRAQGIILNYFFRNKHLLSKHRRYQVHGKYDEMLKSKDEIRDRISNHYKWMCFVHSLYNNVLDEMDETSEHLGNK